ncbi:hypothetical protein MPH_02164 [Macrophomina phaseolina MS6]|uniref:Uncharacterized protein n=1 Tax=Macrophomina phaseolina (strain MS6) TaxID=1126212 RepID=K2S6W0_MACPH|nr:hypothetical protein MPH_02164 [Macrophomina phaseolina MS6]
MEALLAKESDGCVSVEFATVGIAATPSNQAPRASKSCSNGRFSRLSVDSAMMGIGKAHRTAAKAGACEMVGNCIMTKVSFGACKSKRFGKLRSQRETTRYFLRSDAGVSRCSGDKTGAYDHGQRLCFSEAGHMKEIPSEGSVSRDRLLLLCYYGKYLLVLFPFLVSAHSCDLRGIPLKALMCHHCHFIMLTTSVRACAVRSDFRASIRRFSFSSRRYKACPPAPGMLTRDECLLVSITQSQHIQHARPGNHPTNSRTHALISHKRNTGQKLAHRSTHQPDPNRHTRQRRPRLPKRHQKRHRRRHRHLLFPSLPHPHKATPTPIQKRRRRPHDDRRLRKLQKHLTRT